MHVESKITYPQFIILESFFPLPLNEPDTLPSSFPIHRETSMTNVTRLSFLSFEQKEGGRAPWWIIRLDIDSRAGQSISCRLIRGKATKKREQAIGSSNRFVRVGGGGGGRSNVICAIRVVGGLDVGHGQREREREKRVNSEILVRGGG